VLGVRVKIIRYVDNSQPGWIECVLADVQGQEWLFIEKVPVVTLTNLDASSNYPQPGIIACHVINTRLNTVDGEVITIDTDMPWHIESTSGKTRFDVHPDQLLDFAYPS
jgi:hypothetical protein